MKILFTILVICALYNYESAAQHIRTDHREMTPGQKSAFVQAVNAIRAHTIPMADFHAANFNTPIHTTGFGTGNGAQFLPWHRSHHLHMEEDLRAAGTPNAEYLTLPYWDWRVEANNSSVTWDDSNFLALANLHSDLQLTRRDPLGGTLATSTDINTLIAMTGAVLPAGTPLADDDVTSSSFFSKRLEAWHNFGHVFVGGTMGGGTSPRDPVFFLHHGFVDKLWQDWEERDNAVQSVFNFTGMIGNYSIINPNTIIDSRYAKYPESGVSHEVDVWYAYNKKLLLDGLGGNFNVAGSGKVYSYTPWNPSLATVEGTIYSGDIRRDASDNIVADNKGGFIITAGAECVFKSGKEIRLMNGFSAVAGSSFLAQIVTTPHGFTSPTSTGRMALASATPENSEETLSDESASSFAWYPNPVKNELTIEFVLKKESRVRCVVYNSIGQPVYTKSDQSPRPAGSYSEKIDTGNYSNGVYVVQLQTNEFLRKALVTK